MESLPSKRAGRFAAAFFFVFGLPFAGFGVWAFSQAIGLIGAPPGSQSFWYPFMFGVVFSGVGFGLMALAIFGTRRYDHIVDLQTQNPTEPWLWRDDWAAGRVKSRTKPNMVMSWIFASFWNLVSWTIAVFGGRQAIQQKGPGGYFIFLFPAAGIVLLIYAVRQTLAYVEFGKTCFEMASVPGVVGRELKGSIQARLPHSPEHGVHLRLSCVHRYVTGSGNNSTTNETILWREEADLNAGQLWEGPAGTTVPVSFHIPRDAQPTEKLTARDEFQWLLEATASVPGVDYHDVFEIPVFRTAQTPTQEEEAAEEKAFGVHAPELSCPQHLSVRVQPVAGGTEFYFPAGRNKGFAGSITFFSLIFTTIGYFLIHSRAPIIFPIVFGGFGLLMDYFSLKMWLGTTRVVIGTTMSVQSGWLGGGTVRQIALPDITSIDDKITAQQGGGTGTPYYDIEMTLADGKKITLGRTLRDKPEVEWLLGEMQRLAGLKNQSMAAGAR